MTGYVPSLRLRRCDRPLQRWPGRCWLTANFTIIEIDEEVHTLARHYVEEGVVSPRYIADALHIAAAVRGDADILVSWNFTHLVKRSSRLLVNYVNTKKGLRSIEILAPPEI